MKQLTKLSQPFPAKLVHQKPGSDGGRGDYVEHSAVNQALLATVGPFDFKLREIVRGYVPEYKNKKTGEVKPAMDGAVVAVICALTVEVDGKTVTIEEVGDCEKPHNWSNDGARLKDAFSDAIKRCAFRLGLGLHLYAQEDYFLHESLKAKEAGDERSKEHATKRQADGGKDRPKPTPKADAPDDSAGSAGSDRGVQAPAPKRKAPDKPSPVVTARKAQLRKLIANLNFDPSAWCAARGKDIDTLEEDDLNLLIAEAELATAGVK